MQTRVDRGARTITYFSVGAPELYPTRTGAIPPDRVRGATVYSEQQFADIAAQGVRVNFFNFAILQQRVLVGGEAQRFGFVPGGAPHASALHGGVLRSRRRGEQLLLG